MAYKDNIIRRLERIKAKLPEGFVINIPMSCTSASSAIYATHAAFPMTPPLVWRDGKWKSTGI